jgi:hypothetical protein
MYDHALNSNQIIPLIRQKKRRSQSAVLCCAVLCCAVKIISLTAMPVYLRCNISIIFRIAEMSGFINHFNLIL